MAGAVVSGVAKGRRDSGWASLSPPPPLHFAVRHSSEVEVLELSGRRIKAFGLMERFLIPPVFLHQ